MPTPKLSLPLTAPVIDCEPPALPLGRIAPGVTCPAPTVLHGGSARRMRLIPPEPEPRLQPGAAQFADMALRRVLEVVDRRRPPAQLKALMSQLLIDAVVTAAKSHHRTTASLRRVGLRPAASPEAAELFATYTRGVRVRAIAGRIELRSGRWRLTALQLG
ncbi:Rv3235 family protein [Mycolicibacterium neworleansense]|uniref:Putative alanine arginine proline rich protein n=1 Tax=Mycolicibacterium neworleansense TaxID=146018 RepID=A0A0H5RN67_9MYCO|nr:Rv3235 family protein [Mycolicibacterium neworleansense]CRZ15610.1 putative alanine arginine proline rich protein [Mycolicibacterium neworleansense]